MRVQALSQPGVGASVQKERAHEQIYETIALALDTAKTLPLCTGILRPQ